MDELRSEMLQAAAEEMLEEKHQARERGEDVIEESR